ncbi:hypothetical protein DW1_1996 [Proteiniborus sp. DW1]|uniref:BofC C-terminal domain-containing protein n=1 Tax=Proteiniborus sp. DW1 TaxID=1889883 RepID=UPI00092E1DF0|nr:BofC C-terminal domain-containing protein [Proteiniborus sp. DW1]SCG83563.1 hypothetical protein DW1_1996 [Proteiniborus sp. DW1]
MKRISVVSTIAILFGLAAAGMLSGYFIGIKNTNQKSQPQIENIVGSQDNPEDERIDTIDIDDDNHETGMVNEEKIGPSTILEYKIYYSECGHEAIKTVELENHMVNMSEDDFQKYIKGNHPKWEIESFSHEKILVKINKDHLCQNHYIIGVKNGKIAVFTIGENGERLIKKIYNDSPISLLKEVDQKKLEKGIITNSKEELEDILENYIS